MFRAAVFSWTLTVHGTFCTTNMQSSVFIVMDNHNTKETKINARERHTVNDESSDNYIVILT